MIECPPPAAAASGPRPPDYRWAQRPAGTAVSYVTGPLGSSIPLYYQGHAYRTGSRIRVTISAPNGDQPIWSFGERLPKGTAKVTIAHSRMRPSRLLLPVVPGLEVPTGLPLCPGLRGEPCRDYRPIANRKG